MTNNPPPPPPPDSNQPPPPPDSNPQYQQPQYQQPQYQQGYGQQFQPRPHPRGTLILVLGILSLFCFGIVLGTIAFVMGNNALKEIDANPSAYTNRSTVNAGRIIGLIGAILSVISIIYFVSVS